MKISNLLTQLPHTLESMLVIELSALKPLASDARVRELFGLRGDTQLEAYSHVVWSNEGRALARRQDGALVDAKTNAVLPAPAGQTLSQRFQTQLALFPVDVAQAYAIASPTPGAPAVFHLELGPGELRARCSFTQKPTPEQFELLERAGVLAMGAEYRRDADVLHFEAKLPVELKADALTRLVCALESAFEVKPNVQTLEAGRLLEASETTELPEVATPVAGDARDPVIAARNQTWAGLERLAHQALSRRLAMRWDPPPPKESVPFGDIVPLGVLANGLRANPASVMRPRVVSVLQGKKLRGLWSFQDNDLETATDSSLVLLGVDDRAAVAQLEQFTDGRGGYLPQLAGITASAGTMMFEPAKRHWCQADYATTALVQAARKRTGLGAQRATQAYLKAGFATRGGLYFANPYLVDWCVAQALEGEAETNELRTQLMHELLGSVGDDCLFGRFDRPASTAYAILALHAAGYRGPLVRAAQQALAATIDAQGLLPVSTPFYSSLLLDGDEQGERIVQIKQYKLGVSLHVDVHRMIGSAAAALALSLPTEALATGTDIFAGVSREVRPRYAFESHADYAARYALLPYLQNPPSDALATTRFAAPAEAASP